MPKIMSKLMGKDRKTSTSSAKHNQPEDASENCSQQVHDDDKHVLSRLLRTINNATDMCRWLSDVTNLVQSKCEQLNSIHDVPRKMHVELKMQVNQLLRFRREYAETVREIERIEFQIAAVQNLKDQTKHKLRKARAEEEKKSEDLVDACWKPLRGRWLSLKTKRSQVELEKFINEAKEKKKGLEIIIDLAQTQMSKLKLARAKQQRIRKERTRNMEDADDEADEIETTGREITFCLPLPPLFEDRERNRSHSK